ncbi:MAG: PilZ domain-containing protein [Myxococcaceae bacterium]
MELNPPTSTPPSAERRREARVPTRIEVRFTDAAHAARVLHAYSLDFSLGGLCLRTRRGYAVGRKLALSLVVGTERLPVQAVVAWVRPSDKAVGLRFVEVADELRRRLLELMQLVVARAS